MEDIVLYGAGDIMPYTKDPDECFSEVAPLFKDENAVVFGQLEAVLGKTKYKVPQCRLGCSADESLARTMKRNGFDVVSFGSNHSLDYGTKAFLETLDIIEEAGLIQIGSGRDEEDAHTIKIVEKNGTKIAFIGYCSILPQSYWAWGDRPGCTPARGLTITEPREPDQPGTPVDMYTFPHPYDLQRMKEDVRKAKELADIVVVSIHWGIHFIKATLADYQRYYAYAAIEAGADIILGHHAHTLKPIEIYKGKVIFYSLGNFSMTEGGANPADIIAAHGSVEAFMKSKARKVVSSLQKSEPVPGRQKGYDWYVHTLCKAVIRDKRIVKVSFIPTFWDEQSITRIPEPGNVYYEKTMDLMNEITEMVGLDTKYPVVNGEVVLVES